jgi:tellurite resistance protein
MVGFENKSAVAAREHTAPINDGEYDNITSTEGKVVIRRTTSYRALIKADTHVDTKQQGVDASSKVDVNLAVSKYLGTIFTGGAGSAMMALDALVAKPSDALTSEEALALAVSANKKNGGVQPGKEEILAAVEKYLPSASTDKAKEAAMALINDLKSKKE